MAAEWRGRGRIDEGSGWRDVEVELAGRHLGVIEAGAAPRWWSAGTVRDEGGGRFSLNGGVRLEVSDLRLGELLKHAPSEQVERLWPKIAALLACLAVLAWAGWRYALPALAEGIARLVPVEYEKQLGAAIADAFASPATLAKSDEAQRALERMAARLARGFEGKAPYEFRPRLHCTAEINAAAAPGGIILVLDGLVRRVESPGQLTAILAHEMQHVALRHGMRAIFRRSALQIGFGLLAGDLTSVAALAATGLTDLGYSRDDELEADREGLKLMARAGFDPQGMLSMFALFAQEDKAVAGGLSYLRTHPFPSERQAEAEKLMAGLQRGAPVTVDEAGWQAIRQACRE